MSDFRAVLSSREGARAQFIVAMNHAAAMLDQGERVLVTVKEVGDERSLQQLRFYWGPCLREISEQAVINGQRYTAEAFHELFKRQFLGYEIKKIKVAGRKKLTVIRRLKSSTDLSVRQFSDYLDKVQAFATVDLSVRFSVRDWYEHAGIERPAPRRRIVEELKSNAKDERAAKPSAPLQG